MSDMLKTNDQEFEFNPDAVESIDQSSVEGGGPSYPIIQWVLGDMKARKYPNSMEYRGGFFIKSDGKVDGATLEAAGWTKTSRTFENGTEEEGYWRDATALSVISERKRWEVGENGERKSFPWHRQGYEAAKAAAGTGKPRSRAQYLVLIKGTAETGPLGPFVLTMKGSAGMAFDSSRNDSVLQRFEATVIAAANDKSAAAAKAAGKAPKKWAYRAFWLPTGSDRNDKGEPVYTTVGSGDKTTNVVLPTALGLPDKAINVDLKRFYVGDAILKQVNTLFDEHVEWRAAWNTQTSAEDVATSEQTTAAAAVRDAEDAALAATGL